MNILTSSSNELSQNQQQLFQQGADAIVCQNDLSVGLWYSHTPIYEGRQIGTIGGCELNDSQESVQLLTDAANYLHETHGCQTVVGPMNANTWLQHRLILETNGRDPFLMEPVEPDYFHALFSAAGFSILSKYSSSSIDLTKEQSHYQSIEDRLKKTCVTTRSINPDQFEKDLNSIFDLSLVSFADNFLYTPISRDLFVGKYMSARDSIDPELVILAERDDELVGYVFCMPDLLAKAYSKKPAIIIKTLACQQERSLAGLGTYLVAKAQEIAKTKGYTEAIHALQFENNSSLRISQRFDATIFRRYGLMAKHFKDS